jgi:predicted DNA-binding protein
MLWHHYIITSLEARAVVRMGLRLPLPIHEKLRWLAYKERRSQHAIALEILEKALKRVEVPKEGRRR